MNLSARTPSTGPSVRADELASKREVLGAFTRRSSPRVIAAAAAALGAARIVLGGGFGRGDVIVIAVTIAITGTVEWVIHKYLLHAGPESWRMRVLGTGAGHRQHHLDPPDLGFLLLRGIDAVVFVVAFGAVTALWSVPVLWLTGSAVLGGFLTAWLCAVATLGHYEWVHLLVHSRYRPRTRLYRGLARHHRLHHYRNEHYWLGVTSNTGDRLLGTLPGSKADVPLSDTAKTLSD